jgi:hypothetical protein
MLSNCTFVVELLRSIAVGGSLSELSATTDNAEQSNTRTKGVNTHVRDTAMHGRFAICEMTASFVLHKPNVFMDISNILCAVHG